MSTPNAQRDPVERLAEEFAERLRRGERPGLAEYTDRYPELADEIRDLFPALVVMEQYGSVADPLSAPPAVLTASAPDRLGDFRILREVGRGGMGVVYEAVQESLGRHVALKVLPAGPRAQGTFLERFRREAQAAAKLHHTNIVPVFGVGETAGVHFYAMQYIHGQGLDIVLTQVRRLRGATPAEAAPTVAAATPALSAAHSLRTGHFAPRRTDPDIADVGPPAAPPASTSSLGLARQPEVRYFCEVARLAAQAADGLSYAHAQGVLHRDIKPSNLLIDTQGTLWIADFGLAKADDSDDLTGTGDLVGTLRYMAPERFRGAADARSDVYALGVTLYELLTLRSPYDDADRLRLVKRIEQGGPPRPRQLDPLIPRDLETVVLKAMAAEPDDRYATAGALAEDLRRVLADRPVRARRHSLREQAWRWCRRNPAVASLTAAAATLLVAAAVGAAVAAVQYRLKAQVEARAKEELETSLYFHRIALAHRELAADNLGRALELLNECPEGLRLWEWYYLRRLCRVDPVIVQGNKKGIYSVAFSPDGRRLASANADGTVGLYDVATGQEIRSLRGHEKYVFGVAFHPDGRRVASASADRTVKVWDLASGQAILSLSGHQGDFMGTAYGVAFSPDGRLLAAGSDEETVTIWDATTGQPLHALPGHERLASSVAFSPDGRLLATASFGGFLRIWDAQTGQLLRSIRAHDRMIGVVAFRPDGRCLATASHDRTAKVWDATTGEPLCTLAGHTGLVVGLAFSPDGRRLATTGEDRTVKIWDAQTGQEVLNLRGHAFGGRGVAFSPDGRLLASASFDTTIRIWDASPLQGNEGRESLTLGHDGEVWSVAFSPDGRRLASASWDKTVRIWDATSGAPLRSITHVGMAMCVAFSPPDGNSLAAAAGVGQRGSLGAVLKVWDVRTGAEVLHTPTMRAFCVTFSPDGQYFLKEGKEHTVQVWDLKTNQERGILGRHAQDIWSLKFSPDGKLVASASNDFTVKLWDGTRLLQEQEPLLTIRLPNVGGFADRIAFSPDSRRLVTGGEEHTVKIWDATSRQPKLLHTLSGHTGQVSCVAVSPDGRWLASAGEDTTVRLWNATTGAPLHKLRGHTSLVSSVAFSPDGRRLVSGSRDRTVKVWDLTQLDKPR